jgi:hypothetical protein
VNAFPWVGDLLRLGPKESDAVSLAFSWMEELLKVGFILAKPVKPTPGADVTPNKGLGLSGGAGDSRDSAGGGVDVNGLSSGFLSEVIVVGIRGDLAEKLLEDVDHADGPAFAIPNGDIVEAKDKKPL